jgi:hypothetical protein
MSKKSFSGGLDALLGEKPPEEQPGKPRRGRPKTQNKKITKSSQEGTKENETRATFIVKEQLLEEIKSIAYWERDMIKNIINSALEEAVANYKKKNGTLKPLPRK